MTVCKYGYILEQKEGSNIITVYCDTDETSHRVVGILSMDNVKKIIISLGYKIK
jgi:hypothetical protein